MVAAGCWMDEYMDLSVGQLRRKSMASFFMDPDDLDAPELSGKKFKSNDYVKTVYGKGLGAIFL